MSFIGFSLIPIKATALMKSAGVYSLQQQSLPLLVGIYAFYKEHRQFMIQETLSTIFKCFSDSQQSIY
jgi:hypothetical protein